MVLFELVIGLLFAGALFALWSDRLGIPYPALLAFVGTLVALVPGTPGVGLDPHLALALFVAPTLLDAAYDVSLRDLRDNLVSVAGLAVGLVLLTVVAVAWAARLAVPGMGWAAAITLGAIVAPPDASAATAVLRKLRPPHRLLVILEGESLFNDATALLIYRVAVGAAMTGAFTGWSLIPTLLLSWGGGVVAGWVFARIQIWIGSRVQDIPMSVMLQFIVTFALWMVAERLGLSAILAVVVFAMILTRRVAGRQDARHRIASYAVWDVAVLVLNVLAFVLIGLQVRGVLARMQEGQWRTYALCAGVVCAAVILVRIAWVMPYTAALRWKQRHSGARPGARHRRMLPPYGSGILASWCGMRGIITLATALALPIGPSEFPHRDLIIFSAFCVVMSTLVVQGMTLAPLLRWLGLRDDGTVEREIGIARAETARAALRVLDDPDAQGAASPSAELLRSEYRARLKAEEPQSRGADRDEPGLAALQRRAVDAQRESLRDLRASNVIGDDAFHVVEEDLDLLELTAESRVRPVA